MHVVVSQIDKVLFSGDARAVIVPGTEGEMTILPNHVPLVSALREGTITVIENVERKTFPVTAGFIEYSNGITTILL